MFEYKEEDSGLSITEQLDQLMKDLEASISGGDAGKEKDGDAEEKDNGDAEEEEDNGEDYYKDSDEKWA